MIAALTGSPNIIGIEHCQSDNACMTVACNVCIWSAIRLIRLMDYKQCFDNVRLFFFCNAIKLSSKANLKYWYSKKCTKSVFCLGSIWSISISISAYCCEFGFIIISIWECNVHHFIRFVKGKSFINLRKPRRIHQYLSQYLSSSQFQNKSSNPHSEFTCFDVHIFKTLQCLQDFYHKEMVKY